MTAARRSRPRVRVRDGVILAVAAILAVKPKASHFVVTAYSTVMTPLTERFATEFTQRLTRATHAAASGS